MREPVELARRHGTTSLLVVHRGEVVLEEASPPPAGLDAEVLADGRTREDVASVQKSVTSLLVGLAVHQRLLHLDDAVSDHLGDGWTRATTERRITVRHLLTMTSGLDDSMCAVAEPGTVWSYNLGAAYHSLKRVVAAAAGADLSTFTHDWLLGPLGLAETSWRPRALPPVVPEAVRPFLQYPDGEPFEALWTTARDLARLGRLVVDGGRPLPLEAHLAEALRPATPLNPAYGLLWWLNGQPWSLAPRAPAPVDGWLWPDGPADLVAALGALGRSLHVSASADLVVVRLGADPGESPLATSRFTGELVAAVTRELGGTREVER